MASTTFESAFNHAMDALKGRLMADVTLTYVADSTTASLKVSFVEQIGFVDDRLRAVFTFDADDLATDVQRGDYFVLDGQTQRWYAVNIQNDQSGGVEVRCDAMMERL